MAADPETPESESGPVLSFPAFKREWKGWDGTDTQVESGFRCYRRPNRETKRTWDARAAARACCQAIKNGHTFNEISREVQKKCNVKTMDCDCERVSLTLRQILFAAAAVAIALALSRFVVVALPVILNVVVLRLLPRALAGRLGVVKEAVQRLPEATRTIEGIFVRVREDLAAMSRLNP